MPDEPLNIKDFAARIKERHPDYAEVEDHELAYRVLEKFPDYKSSVSLPKLTRARTNDDHINNIRTLNPEFADTMQGFSDFAKQRGLSDAYIKSGYRTAKDQNDIFKGPRGKFTKGNDGYENISPHQEARATDWSTKDPANKPLLHTLIRAYARKKKLHVPGDEPWHMAGSRGTQSSYLARIRALLESPPATSQGTNQKALSKSEQQPKPSQPMVVAPSTVPVQAAQPSVSPMGDTQPQPPMDVTEQPHAGSPPGVSGFTGNVGRIMDHGPHAEAAYREFLQRNVPQVKGKAVSSDELLKDETLATVFTKIQDFVQANPKAKPREQARALAQMGIEFLKDPATTGKQLPRVLHVALLESQLSPQEMSALPRVMQRQIQEHQGRQATAQKQQIERQRAIAGAKKQWIAEAEETAKNAEPNLAEKIVSEAKNASEKQVIAYAKNRRLIDENTLGEESTKRFQRDADWMRAEVEHTQGLARQVLTGQEHQKIVKEELSRQGPGLKPLPKRLQARGVPVEATYKILAPTQAEIAERRLESLPRAAQAPVAAAWDFLSGQAHRVANMFDVMSGEKKFESFYDEPVRRLVRSGGGREQPPAGEGKPLLPKGAQDALPTQALKDIGAFFRTQSEQLAQGAKAVSDENEGNFFTYTLPHAGTTAGLTLIELATLKKATGASLGTVFGASTFVDTLDQPAKEQRSATLKAYLLGTFFEKLPEAALKPLLEKLPLGKKVGDWIAGASERRLQRLAGAPLGAAVGGGLAYESGKSKEGIIADSLVWAGIGGIPELVGLAKKAPEATIRSPKTPETLREVVGKATGKRPVVLQSEGENPRFASVYVDPKSGENIPREVTAAEASSLLSKDRPARIVPKEQFEEVFGSKESSFQQKPKEITPKPVEPQNLQSEVAKGRDNIPGNIPTEVKDAGETRPPDTTHQGLVPREGALERGSGAESLRSAPKPKESAQVVEAQPVQGESEVKALLDRHENKGDLTVNDLVNHIEGATENPRILAAVEKYREEAEYDRSLKGRGDMDAAEEEFLRAVQSAQKGLVPKLEGIADQPVSPTGPPEIALQLNETKEVPENAQQQSTEVASAVSNPKLTVMFSEEGAGGISGDTPAPSIAIPLDQLKRSELKQRVRQGGARAQEYQQELDRRYESRGLAQFVRDSGGIAPGEMYAGELARLNPKETGTTGLINQNARTGNQKMSLEYMMDAANEEGYRDPGGNKFEHPGDFALAVESDFTGARKGYTKLTSGDEIDWDYELQQHNKKEQEVYDQDAMVSLLENDQSGIIYDRIQEGKANESDLEEFRKYASDLHISPEATEDLITSARSAGIQEAPATSPEKSEQVAPAKQAEVFAEPNRAPDPILNQHEDPVEAHAAALGHIRMPVSEQPEPGFEKSRVPAAKVIKSYEEVFAGLERPTPIRTGRMGTRDARGLYYPHAEIIRLRTANNLPTAAHETGHGVQKIIMGGMTAKHLVAPTPVKRELVNLGRALYGSRKPNGGYRTEGFAEFMRLYLTHDDVSTVAPETLKFFEEQILPNHPELAKGLKTAREQTDAYRKQGAKNRGQADIEKTKNVLGRGWAKVGDAISRSPKAWVDEFTPLFQLSEAAQKKAGPLAPSQDPPILASALRATAGAKVEYMINDNMIDFAGNVVGPALRDATSIVKGKEEDFALYLHAKRAQERWSKNKNPGMSQEDADSLVKALETPEFQIAAQKVYDWNDGVLSYVEQAVPSMAETIKRIRKESEFYVPLRRVFEPTEVKGGKGQGVTGGLKRMKGSGRAVKEIFPQIISNAERMISMAHKRAVLDSIVRLSDIEGLGFLVEEVPKDKVPTTISAEQAAEALKKLGYEDANIQPADLDEMLTFFTPAQYVKGEIPIVPVMRGGEMKWFQIDPEVYNTLAGVDLYHMHPLLDLIFGAPTRLFRIGTTGLRPAFSLLTNPMRDVQTFFMQTQSSKNPARLAASWVQSMAAAFDPRRLAGKRDPYLDLFYRLGAQLGQPLGIDIAVTRKVSKELFHGQVINSVTHPINLLRELLSLPESASRTAELRAIASEVGWTPGQPMTIDQNIEMTLAAKRVTVDFSAAGYLGKIMNQSVPFFNATVQGARSFARVMRDNPRRGIIRGLLLITLPTLFLWWKNKDEEWYADMPDREKHMYWHIQEGEQLVQIPKAFEWGNLFAVAPEAVFDAWYRRDPEGLKGAVGHVFKTTAPDPWPVLAKTAKEQWQNRIDFFDRPIVPRGELDLPPGEQVGPYTSALARYLGEKFPDSISPRRVDAAIRSVGGGVAGDVVAVAGAPARMREDEPSDLPVIGRLFRRGGAEGINSKVMEKFYDELSYANAISKSKVREETAEQRQYRLLLSDANKAVGVLRIISNEVKKLDERQQLTRLTRTIVRTAVDRSITDKERDRRIEALLRSDPQTANRIGEIVQEKKKETRQERHEERKALPHRAKIALPKPASKPKPVTKPRRYLVTPQ